MHKADVNTEVSKKQIRSNSTAAKSEKDDICSEPLLLAIAAVDMASLGRSCIDDTLVYLSALKNLAQTDGLNEKNYVSRLSIIRDLAGAGERFAEEMSGLMESYTDENKMVLEKLRKVAQ